MSDFELTFIFDYEENKFSIAANGEEFSIPGTTELALLTQTLGLLLSKEKGLNYYNLRAKPKEGNIVRNAQIITLKIPRQDEVPRE